MRKEREYRIEGAYDTETSNIEGVFGKTAFFCLYQVLTLSVPVEQVTADNVRDVSEVRFFRHWEYLYAFFRDYVKHPRVYVPVFAVHNLSFDMHSISKLLLDLQSEGHEVRVLAKSPQKPLTMTVYNGKTPVLCFWDTLSFTLKSLEKMGEECGYRKSVGYWNYNRVRTPETELEPLEVEYAANDVRALVCWLGWFLRRESDVEPGELARTVITKTGVVRAKRRKRLEPLRSNASSRTVGTWWHIVNQKQALRDDDMLMTFHACTRGGFTFASSKLAGVPLDFTGKNERVFAFDAKSQHPAQMVSHFYPRDFRKASPKMLDLDRRIVGNVSREKLLSCFEEPFHVAFCACFEFHNLRMKGGSVFERDGIATLAHARVKSWGVKDEKDEYREYRRYMGMSDDAPYGCSFSFGKVESAPVIRLFLTELEYWIMTRVYDWDACVPLFGYDTARFIRPTDLSVLSVMRFYSNKNIIKQVRKLYTQGEPLECDWARSALPEYLCDEIAKGTASQSDIHLYYMSAKSDLNALYGIEVTNEAKRDMELTGERLEYVGAFGADNLPAQCKTWYQFGQRIVGWSRVAQIVHIELLGRGHRIVNGDTDSLKVIAPIDYDAGKDLLEYGGAIDSAKERTCKRVREAFPELYDELADIGKYEPDGVYTRFYSAWNKAYITDDWHMTIAGIPAAKRSANRFDSLEDYARKREKSGETFADVCHDVLGYNVGIDASITKLNERKLPSFASFFDAEVTDWRGDTFTVHEPRAVGLFPMVKVLGGTDNADNAVNYERSRENACGVRSDSRLILYDDSEGFDEVEL